MISDYIHRIIQAFTLATSVHIAEQRNHYSCPTLSVSVSNVSSRLFYSCLSWIQTDTLKYTVFLPPPFSLNISSLQGTSSSEVHIRETKTFYPSLVYSHLTFLVCKQNQEDRFSYENFIFSSSPGDPPGCRLR